MLADKIDSRVLAVYNVQQSWGRACPGEQIGEDHRSAWHAFRRFQNGRVSACDRDRERPKGYHRGEIERADGGSYAKGKFVGNYVHIGGDIWRALPHLERRNRGTRVHHLCNINQRVCDLSSLRCPSFQRERTGWIVRDASSVRVSLCMCGADLSENTRCSNEYRCIFFSFTKLTQPSKNVTFGIGHCLPVLLHHVLRDFFLQDNLYHYSR